MVHYSFHPSFLSFRCMCMVMHSPSVNSFWNVFITGCCPHTKANDLSKSLSLWHISYHVCILRDKFNQWTQRLNSFLMMRFWDMLVPVLHKCKRKLGNAVLATSANRVKITLACMAFQGHAWQEWDKAKHVRDLLKIGAGEQLLIQLLEILCHFRKGKGWWGRAPHSCNAMRRVPASGGCFLHSSIPVALRRRL